MSDACPYDIIRCACGLLNGRPIDANIMDNKTNETTYYPCMGLFRHKRRLFRSTYYISLGVHFWHTVVHAPSHPRFNRWVINTNSLRHMNVLSLYTDEPQYVAMHGYILSDDGRICGMSIDLPSYSVRVSNHVRLMVYVWRLQRFVRQVVIPRAAVRRLALMMGLEHARLGEEALVRCVPIDVMRALVLKS